MKKKKRQTASYEELQNRFQENRLNLLRLRELHAFLDQETNRLSDSPVTAYASGKFKELKLAVRSNLLIISSLVNSPVDVTLL